MNSDAITANETRSCAVAPGSETLLSDTLDILASGCAGDTISVDDLTSTLGTKCFAGLLFCLAAPNIVPTPPFVDIALSIPLAILSVQLIAGMRRPWLPAWILRREVSTDRFATVVARLSPLTRRVEIVMKRRLTPLTGVIGHRVIALVCLALSVVLALPIPLGNAVTGGAIALFALGLMYRDGVAVLAGAAATAAAGAIAAGIGYGTFRMFDWLAQLQP